MGYGEARSRTTTRDNLLVASAMTALIVGVLSCGPQTICATHEGLESIVLRGNWKKLYREIKADSCLSNDPVARFLYTQAAMLTNSTDTLPIKFEIPDTSFIDTACEWAAGLAEREPDNAVAAYLLGETLSRRHPLAAVACYNRALEINRRFTPAQSSRAGEIGLTLGLHEEAARALKKIVDAHPNMYATYTTRAIVLSEMGEHERAIADCDRFLNKKIFWGYGNAIRGIVHLQAGNFSYAIIDFTDAIATDKHNAMLYAYRSMAYLQSGRPYPAISDANRAIDMDSTCIFAHMTRGTIYELTGQWEEAVADFSFVLADSCVPFAYALRGTAYLWWEDYDAALADIDSAYTHDPTLSHLQDIRGLIHTLAAQPDSAIASYDRAIEIDSLNADAWVSRGEAYLTLERYEAAREDYERAITLDSANPRAFFGLAQIYEKDGELVRAKEMYSRFVDSAPPELHYFIYISRSKIKDLESRMTPH